MANHMSVTQEIPLQHICSACGVVFDLGERHICSVENRLADLLGQLTEAVRAMNQAAERTGNASRAAERAARSAETAVINLERARRAADKDSI